MAMGMANLGPWGYQCFLCLGLFNIFCRAGRQLPQMAVASLGHLNCKEMVFLITREQGSVAKSFLDWISPRIRQILILATAP